MSKCNYDEMFNKIEEALSTSENGFSVALLCDARYHNVLQQLFAERSSAHLVILDGNAAKHTLKREINIQSCEFIVYTREFDPIIYEIFNDGTTLLTDSYLLECKIF